jgi:hypothetical protein
MLFLVELIHGGGGGEFNSLREETLDCSRMLERLKQN